MLMHTLKCGEYINGFGIINLFDFRGFENIEEEDFSTLVHEYIHFLQDTTTTFGYAYSAYVMMRLNSIRYNINNNFFDKIPINIENIENAFLKKEIIDILLGDTDSWTYASYNSINIIDVGYKLDDESEKMFYQDILKEYDYVRVPQIKLELKRNCIIEEKIFAFGAMTIMESMANLIELRLFPKERNNLQVQYDFVEILCRRIIPKISERKEFIVAICDASLMYDNPSLILYATIVQMAKEKYEALNINGIYDYFYERNYPYYKDTYLKEIDTLKETYEQLYPHNDNELGCINNYKLSQFEKKEKLFSERDKFIEALMMKEIYDSKQYIISLMKEYHSPIYIINNAEIYSGERINDFESGIIIATKTLYSMLNCGMQNGCELINFCKNNHFSSYNSLSCSNPFKDYSKSLQNSEDISVCPLQFLLYKWNLSTNLNKFWQKSPASLH